MSKIISHCPVCGKETGLDTNFEGEYIVSRIVCENDECDKWDLGEFNRTHEDDAL